jgi:hypothetical protein
MANWGRRPITDAGKPKPYITYLYNDEERIDRRPLGRVERFVDLVGNIVSLQLAGDGDPQRQVTADKLRMQYRRDGFIEHAKCPVRHGTLLFSGQIAKDFSAMPDDLKNSPCDSDPRTLVKRGHDLHATEACPHIEWLIEARRTKELKQAKKRNADRIREEERREARSKAEMELLEFAKDAAEERRSRKSRSTKE